MEALGIGGDRVGARSRILSRLTSKPRRGVLDKTAALNAARDAAEIAELATKASWTGGHDTITPQTLPPHPIKGMHKDVMRMEARRLFAAQAVSEGQVSMGADRRRHAGYRIEEAEKEKEAAGLRVWGARERTLGIGAHKLGFWVLTQWFLQRTVTCLKQWHLNMRSEQGSLKLLYLLLRIHREYLREKLILPWRKMAKAVKNADANAYYLKRKAQRAKYKGEKRNENRAERAAAKAAEVAAAPVWHDDQGGADQAEPEASGEKKVLLASRVYYGIG